MVPQRMHVIICCSVCMYAVGLQKQTGVSLCRNEDRPDICGYRKRRNNNRMIQTKFRRYGRLQRKQSQTRLIKQTMS